MAIRFDSKLVRSILISASFWIIPLLLEKIIYILGLSTFIWAILSSDVSPSNTIFFNTLSVVKIIESLIGRVMTSNIANYTSNKIEVIKPVKQEKLVIKEIRKMNLVELIIYSQDKIDIKNIKGRTTKSKIITELTR